MKKALVILLALTMVLSCMAMVSFGASAEEELAVGAVAADYKPEGTAVNTAAEFAGMAADGTYYLAADITLDATYAVNFTGTLDGNGKTLTVAAPVFAEFNGKLLNVTVKGYIETTDTANAFVGGIAIVAGSTDDTAFTNVRSEITMTTAVVAQGGFVGVAGKGAAKTTTTFTDCANYGYINGGKPGNNGSAAFVANGEAAEDKVGLVFEGCENYGDVNAKGRVGAFVGTTHCSAKFIDCVNEGDITSADCMAGGFAGRISPNTASYKDTYLFENCVNRGDIKGTYNNSMTGIGGLVGNGDAADEVVFKNCVNYGDVVLTNRTHQGNVGGIIGALTNNATKFVAENCVNYGQIGLASDATATRTVLNRAGGIAGYVGAKKVINFSYCYNYGDVYGKLIAGGIAGVGMGTPCDDITYTACGNYGKITCKSFAVATGSRAGGLVGHLDHAAFATPVFTYCYNLGIVDGDAFVGGMVGYSNANPKFIYNFVAGETISTRAIVAVADGGAVSAGSHSYSYQGVNGTRYFRAPDAGKVAITGDKVVLTSSAAYPVKATVVNGDTVANRQTYTFEANGKMYAFYALADGTVAIDATAAMPVASVNGTVCNVIEWNFDATNTVLELDTYDHPVRTAAFVWGQQRGFEIDMTKNFVLKDAADVASIQGFGEKWWNMPTNTKGYVGVTEADFASGKVASELNTMSGENIFRQNLNAQLFEVDAYPTTDTTHAKVVNIGGVYGNQLFDVDNDAGSPATGDAMVYVVVALAVSAISLAAVVVVKKVKEN